jgi:hypothetical protein
MRRTLGLLVVAWLGCAPATGPDQASFDGGTDPLSTTCVADEQCPAGMVCEGCPIGDKTCLPGCRVDAQCPKGMVCSGTVLCTTCPCAPGWCDLDPCRDVDGDGYAPTTDANVSCPGKQLGDCDDARAWAHPGLREVCWNGVDDDCDGQTDLRDNECQACTSGQTQCSASQHCGARQTCERGCCETCALQGPATCAAGQCSLPGGIDPVTGCARPEVCGDCSACPNTPTPVCGLNGATYFNGCYAVAAGTQVLYGGECLRAEQQWCQGDAFQCLSGQQYCRGDAAGDGRCTRFGSCVQDSDCAKAVRETVLCADGSVAPLACSNLRCVAVCQ